MTLKKITSLTVLVLGSLIMTISCEEPSGINKSSNQSTMSAGGRILNYTFDGTEGDPITLATATSWYLNYNTKNLLTLKSHFFGATVLKKILAAKGAMGIRIYYAIDDNGDKQLLLLGADNKGGDLLPKSGAQGISSSLEISGGAATDSFTGIEETWVSEEATQRWIANYASQYPQGLIAHFFGFAILNQILGETDCIGIRMYYALNDSGVQQILLVGVNSQRKNILPLSLNGGKVMDDPTIGDASFPCPSYCP